mgnify:CR=1 FL=1
MARDKTRFTARESKALASKYLDAQQTSDVEKAVEKVTGDFVEMAVRKRLGEFGTVTISHPYNTDGIVRFIPSGGSLLDGATGFLGHTEFLVLVEAKKDMSFSGDSKADRDKVLEHRAVVLAQVVYYYHKIREEEGRIPAAVVVADNDEMFVLSGKVIKSYLDKDYDWSIAPSAAGYKNPELVKALREDKNVSSIYVYHINRDFDFNNPADRLFAAIENTRFEKIIVTPDNLARAFDDFNKRVFGASTVDTMLQMSVFVQSLLGNEDIFSHPVKANTLMYAEQTKSGDTVYKELSPSKELPLDLGAYQEFFEEHDRNSYTLSERKAITEIADTLIEDFDRRFHGDFWTPKVWADEAHKLISNALNEYEVDENGKVILEWDGTPRLKEGTTDWKNRYVTWDAACGSKNLTRDYKWGPGKLFLSTLHNEELAVSSDYNPEATTFQYDFLNDDIELHEAFENTEGGVNLLSEYHHAQFKMPPALLEALKNNEPIVFFMNPPYGQATEQEGNTKAKIADTEMGKLMRPQKMGHATSELYTQFIRRVQMLADTFAYDNEFHFFFFFNKGFLTSPSFKRFTQELTTDFSFEDGFMLNAGEFSGTSTSWGIIFSHWKLKDKEDRKEEDRQEEFPFVVKQTGLVDSKVEIFDKTNWLGRNIYKGNISDFIPSQKHKKILDVGDFPATSNGFEKSKSKKPPRGRMFSDSLGYAQLNGSNVQYSDKYTSFYSLCFAAANGQPVAADNFDKIAVHYSVRKAWQRIIADQDLLWVRDKDVFPAPTKDFQDSDDWGEFVADSVVYSLFEKGSNQSSMRDYEYGENEDGTPRLWDIENQFFWHGPDFIEALATERENGRNTKNFNLAVQQDLQDFGGPRFVHNWLTEHANDLSDEGQVLLDIADQILIESFKYRDEYAKQEPLYQANTWDAGWEQIRRMVYSNTAHPDAKKNKKLIALKEEFDTALRALGDKIAYRYSEDTGF